MILGAITGLLLHNGMFTQEVIMGAATAILGGIGLIFAKDSDVSGKSR